MVDTGVAFLKWPLKLFRHFVLRRVKRELQQLEAVSDRKEIKENFKKEKLFVSFDASLSELSGASKKERRTQIRENRTVSGRRLYYSFV